MFNETTYDLALGAGCSPEGARMAAAIAQAESSGNARAYNPETAANTPQGQGSYGLWQIYRKAHPEFAGQDLYNPAINAAAMFSVSGGCQNWNPWSTFKNGAYRSFLGPAPVTPSDPQGSDSATSDYWNSENYVGAPSGDSGVLASVPSWAPLLAIGAAAYFLLR